MYPSGTPEEKELGMPMMRAKAVVKSRRICTVSFPSAIADLKSSV
jgi:hypothetical protein